MRIVLIGPPGAGKGTQAQRISQKYGLAWLSTGVILRKAVSAGTALGKQIETLLSEGKLVPDMIVTQLVENHINLSDNFLLDGYPRNVNQAVTLDKILKIKDMYLDCVIKINVPDDEVEERVISRIVCPECGYVYHAKSFDDSLIKCANCDNNLEIRHDDSNIKIVQARLKIYHQDIKELSDYYQKQNILYSINGSNKIDEVFELISNILDKIEN